VPKFPSVNVAFEPIHDFCGQTHAGFLSSPKIDFMRQLLKAISKMFLIAKKQDFGSEQGAKSAHSHSYVSFLQHSSGAKDAFVAQRIILRWLLIWIVLGISVQGFAQLPIVYQLDLSNIHHHELGVSVIFSALPDDALRLHMPTASPGRYARHAFAKNIYDLVATNENGDTLNTYRTGIDTWEVTGHQGYAQVQYTLFANRADGTYSGVDNRKVHLNMPATFLYGNAMEDRPVHLTWNPTQKKGWEVATQLEQLDEATFRAPNYYYFYDSPTFIGPINWRRWTSTSNQKEYTIEVAMIHEGTETDLDAYAKWVKAIVEEQKAVYGSLPDFDFGRYTFLCAYNPWVAGDGMEHRNSTICSSSGNLADNASRLIGTISHEFFHAWNVERIRPADLEPFNFTKANMSDALWFAEGFTSYYDDLVLKRAGIISADEYITGLTGTINYVFNSPGRLHRNPVQMSRQAPFVDAAASIDPNNFGNTFISYYSYGAVLGLMLDLELRTRFDGITLDDYMQYLWTHYGQPEVPYTITDLRRALGEVTGDEAFAKNFFNRHIYDAQLTDLPERLSPFGIVMEKAYPDASDFRGMHLDSLASGWKINRTIPENHSLYAAGLERGDIILRLDGIRLSGDSVWETLVVGSTHSVTYLQNGKEERGTFTVLPNRVWILRGSEDLTEEMAGRQSAWLSSKQ